MPGVPNYTNSDQVYWKILRDKSEKIPHKDFLQFQDQPAQTFGAVFQISTNLAYGLSNIGVKKDDTVLLMLNNCLEFLYISFAINMIGAIEVPVNTSYKGDFITHIANNSKAKVLILSERFLGRVTTVQNELLHLEKIVVLYENKRFTEDKLTTSLKFEILDYRVMEQLQGKPEFVESRASDLSIIIYTGGTTGASKGVLLPNASLYFHAHLFSQKLRLSGDDIYYVNLPFFHTNARFVQIGSMLLCGGKALLTGKFSASAWLDDIRKYACTATNTLGVMMEYIYRQPEKVDDADNTLRVMLTAPRPKMLADKFEKRFGVKAVECYGMTEVAGVLFAPYEGGSLRVNEEYFDVKIVNPEDDRELPPNEPGELIVRPKTPWIMMQGYRGMPEKTVEVWRNLWFHTGDLLKVDENGNYYFVDRHKDYIRHKGENISSHEVEKVINMHPFVTESAAIGVKSEIEGGEDEVMVFVVPQNMNVLKPSDIIDFCIERMPHFSIPRFVEIVNELPKNHLRRIEKYRLKEQGVSKSTWDRIKEGYQIKRD